MWRYAWGFIGQSRTEFENAKLAGAWLTNTHVFTVNVCCCPEQVTVERGIMTLNKRMKTLTNELS